MFLQDAFPSKSALSFVFIRFVTFFLFSKLENQKKKKKHFARYYKK